MTGRFRSISAPRYPAEPPTEAVAVPPEQWPPLPVPVRAAPSPRPWAAVVCAWLGGVIATVGAIGPWAHYVDGAERTGLEHGAGWIVLVVAVVAGGVTGAMAGGWRHVGARVGLISASGALFLVFALNRVDVGRASDLVTGGPVAAGGGLFAVALAACMLLVGGLVIPPRVRSEGARPA